MKNLFEGQKVTTITNAVYQKNQKSLNDRPATVLSINGEEVICKVNISGDFATLPFSVNELKERETKYYQ